MISLEKKNISKIKKLLTLETILKGRIDEKIEMLLNGKDVNIEEFESSLVYAIEHQLYHIK